MSDKNAKPDLTKLSFEEALAKLEELVGKMEEGNLPLDQMIAYFEQGTRLTALCRGKLDKLEKKIEVLTRDNGAEGEWEEFDESSERKDASLRPQAKAKKNPPENDYDDNLLF